MLNSPRALERSEVSCTPLVASRRSPNPREQATLLGCAHWPQFSNQLQKNLQNSWQTPAKILTFCPNSSRLSCSFLLASMEADSFLLGKALVHFHDCWESDILKITQWFQGKPPPIGIEHLTLKGPRKRLPVEKTETKKGTLTKPRGSIATVYLLRCHHLSWVPRLAILLMGALGTL